MIAALSILLFILGAAVGSFVSVMVYRTHHQTLSVLHGRSQCVSCSTAIKTFDLIPVVSFLVLRGRCRNCSAEISYSYPLMEIITGGLFVALYFKFPFVDGQLQNFSFELFGIFLLHIFYAAVLIFTFFYDLKYLLVADSILLPAILVSLIATLAYPLTPHIIDAIIGMGIGAGFFALQFYLSGGKWVGAGDIRVGAFMGAILGWKLLLVALVIAYVAGSIVSLIVLARTKKIAGVRIPFAPLLVTGTVAALFAGDAILSWYLGNLGIA